MKQLLLEVLIKQYLFIYQISLVDNNCWLNFSTKNILNQIKKPKSKTNKQ